MKNIGIIAILLLAMNVSAQEDFNEQFAVPLSKPGSRGLLDVGLIRGDIQIVAYDGKEVVINAKAKAKESCDNCPQSSAPDGMKRIGSSSIELSVSEDNNTVSIETNSWKQGMDLEIKIPSNFDLDVSTVNGEISVTGVNGSMEVSSVHGPLTFTDVSGSIVSNTVHGDVIANFKQVTANEPMAFVTLHGNIDVTFPSGIKASTKMKSDRGEIYTDFDMSVIKSKPEVKSGSGTYRVSVESWVRGDINGGGPEYTFKNMHGDIFIRKK